MDFQRGMQGESTHVSERWRTENREPSTEKREQGTKSKEQHTTTQNKNHKGEHQGRAKADLQRESLGSGTVAGRPLASGY